MKYPDGGEDVQLGFFIKTKLYKLKVKNKKQSFRLPIHLLELYF